MLSGGTSSNAPSGTNMVPSSSELIDAVSNPMRRQILRALVEGSGRCASSEELAAALEQPVARIDYHLKTLARCEILQLNERREWLLHVEPDWLGLFLDIWPQSDDGREREGESGAVRRRPPRGRWRR